MTDTADLARRRTAEEKVQKWLDKADRKPSKADEEKARTGKLPRQPDDPPKQEDE